MQLAKPANTRHTKVPQYQHLPLAGKDLHRPFDQPGISIRGSLDGHLTGSILIVGARNVSTWAPSLYCMILSMGTAGCRRARSSCGRLSLDGWEAAREIHLPQKVTPDLLTYPPREMSGFSWRKMGRAGSPVWAVV
jgi:hypothetical protein